MASARSFSGRGAAGCSAARSADCALGSSRLAGRAQPKQPSACSAASRTLSLPEQAIATPPERRAPHADSHLARPAAPVFACRAQQGICKDVGDSCTVMLGVRRKLTGSRIEEAEADGLAVGDGEATALMGQSCSFHGVHAEAQHVAQHKEVPALVVAFSQLACSSAHHSLAPGRKASDTRQAVSISGSSSGAAHNFRPSLCGSSALGESAQHGLCAGAPWAEGLAVLQLLAGAQHAQVVARVGGQDGRRAGRAARQAGERAARRGHHLRMPKQAHAKSSAVAHILPSVSRLSTGPVMRLGNL